MGGQAVCAAAICYLGCTIMRILLVGNYALDNQSSMLRYVDMLCRQMTARGHHVEIIRPKPILGDMLAQPTLRKLLGYVDKYVFFPIRLRFRTRGFDLVHICDHSNSMYLALTGRRPASITCHDLLAVGSAHGLYVQQRTSSTGKLLQRWILSHLRDAHDVVCVSANTAREFARLTGVAAQRVVVIPNALASNCTRSSEESVLRLRNKLGLAAGDRYLFHIGDNHWYKNRIGVLRIFQLLRRRLGDSATGLRMVMAGARFNAEMHDFVASHLPGDSVIEIVNPSDEDLWTLYSGATALLFPSLYEGFGWPLIEAQRCGCPVITSNRPPMSEVAGAAALSIDPTEEVAAADWIAANLSSLEQLREVGYHNAERFDAAVIIPQYEVFFAKALRAAEDQSQSD